MSMITDLNEKITFTIEGVDYKTSFSHEGQLTVSDIMDWFEGQVMPVLGFYTKKEEV